MSDDDMIEMGAMMDDLEEGIAEKDALLATQAAQIEALTKAIKHVAHDAAEFSHGDDTAQRIVRGFSVRLFAALSNTGKK